MTFSHYIIFWKNRRPDANVTGDPCGDNFEPRPDETSASTCYLVMTGVVDSEDEMIVGLNGTLPCVIYVLDEAGNESEPEDVITNMQYMHSRNKIYSLSLPAGYCDRRPQRQPSGDQPGQLRHAFCE